MTAIAEKPFSNSFKETKFLARIIQGTCELGLGFLKSPLTHSLLLTATIGFGIKLNRDHDQALAEVNRPAYTMSQIQQRERVLRSAAQDKRDWERAGTLLAGLTFLRMALASKYPTPEKKHN